MKMCSSKVLLILILFNVPELLKKKQFPIFFAIESGDLSISILSQTKRKSDESLSILN